jgi:hypothetical protein
MAFQKGHSKAGGRSKGSKNKRTILIESVGLENLEQFKGICLDAYSYFLDHPDDHIRFMALKEISKYIFPIVKDNGFNDKNYPEELEPY